LRQQVVPGHCQPAQIGGFEAGGLVQGFQEAVAEAECAQGSGAGFGERRETTGRT
jgi:hypothetical protein